MEIQKNGRFVIFGSCPVTQKTLRRLAIDPRRDCIAAADAGYLRARELGFSPSLLVGDFDSMPLADLPADLPVLRYPAHKDDTDTLLALRAGIAQNYKDFVILGGIGGNRLDHTIANLQSLIFLKSYGCNGLLADSNNTARVLANEQITLPRHKGYLSVFALGDCCHGVTITGVEYPLCDHTLEATFPLGVSNRITQPTATVSVRGGYLLVIESALQP